MSLRKYNIKFSPHALGFRNIGYICYFNAMMQALLSCTAFNECVIYLGDPKQNKPKSIQRTRQLVIQNILNNNHNNSVELWVDFAQIMNIPLSQQCSDEAFILFIEYLNDPLIKQLFQHRLLKKYFCASCNQYFDEQQETNISFYIDASDSAGSNYEQMHQNEQELHNYLTNSSSTIDMECKKCKIKDTKIIYNFLTMIPEILVVVAKKYQYGPNGVSKLNCYTNFPSKLTFNGTQEQLVYEPVAYVQHVGSYEAGHYYAMCKRKNNWYALNDQNVQLIDQPIVDNNTYICMYHIT